MQLLKGVEDPLSANRSTAVLCGLHGVLQLKLSMIIAGPMLQKITVY